jgi:hypothetical protein
MTGPKPDNALRRGMTRRYRTGKLADLEAQLKSTEHREQTPTLEYGEHDPFSVALVGCEACGGQPQMSESSTSKGRRFAVVCSQCNRQAAPQWAKKAWAAALEWNGCNLRTAPQYQALPLFGLGGMDPVAARQHLAAIRVNLEKRKKAAGLRRSLRQEGQGNRKPPGVQYQWRLEAYLKWAMYALRLVKFQTD